MSSTEQKQQSSATAAEETKPATLCQQGDSCTPTGDGKSSSDGHPVDGCCGGKPCPPKSDVPTEETPKV